MYTVYHAKTSYHPLQAPIGIITCKMNICITSYNQSNTQLNPTKIIKISSYIFDLQADQHFISHNILVHHLPEYPLLL